MNTVRKNIRNSTQSVKKLFEYEDYREFLDDFFAEQKLAKKMFSHRYFAQKAGFSSSSAVLKVIKRKTNLTATSTKKVIKGIGLDTLSATYFENLVCYNQAKNREDKEKYFEILNGLRRRSEHYKINKKQIAYFENWYYPVIREIVQYSDWDGDYAKLANLVIPKITAKEAQNAVETLLKIDILRKDKNGNILQTETVLTSKNIPAIYTKKQRREILKLGVDASDNISKDERNISYTTLAVSKKTYKEIEDYLNQVRINILDMAVQDNDADRIYQLIFELFPFSKELRNKK